MTWFISYYEVVLGIMILAIVLKDTFAGKILVIVSSAAFLLPIISSIIITLLEKLYTK